MRIAVTGHRGYIGSAFVDYAQRNYRPFLPGAPTQWKLVDVTMEQDVLKAATVREIKEFAPDVLYNFAGSSGEKQCEGDRDAWELNAMVPVRLLQVVRPKILVQASTCSLYGLGSLYTESKAYAEHRLRELVGDEDASVIAFRFGTVFGANKASMRWDLPMHRMIRDAVTKREVTVPEKVLMRPWLALDTLCSVLWRVATDFSEGGVVPKGFHVVPLVSENASLNKVAGKVLFGCPEVGLRFAPPEDTRDYTAPSVVGDCGINGLAISEIAKLLEEDA